MNDMCRFRKISRVRSGNSVVSGGLIISQRGVIREVFGAHRGAVESKQATSVENAVDDGFGEVVVV